MLDKAKEVGLVDIVFTSKPLPDLSLQQFANDTLLFFPINLEKLKNLKRVLNCFELILGLLC